VARDTYEKIWRRVLLQCPSAGEKRAKQWVSHAFREVAERREWSWKTRYGEFIIPAVYDTGTVSTTLNDATVTGSGTSFTQAMVGRQFRIGTNTPIYTIRQVDSATSLELDRVWGAASDADASYEIYQAFVTVPDDFASFIAVWDPYNNWRLHLNFSQDEINLRDVQRSSSGDAYVVAHRDYATSYAGTIGSVLQVRGTGPDPVASPGTYTAPVDAVFTVEVTTGGATTTAVFQWKKGSGSYTTGVTTAATAQALSDGVQIYWPTGETYVLGDTFIIQATAQDNVGLPRYELYPHKKAAYVYPYLYEADPDDLEDANATLPHYVRGDLLLEYALVKAAMWPGTDKQPNAYYDLALAGRHERRAREQTEALEVADDNIAIKDLSYTPPSGWAPLPFDASFMQTHDIYA
jgi:hypothetical protein